MRPLQISGVCVPACSESRAFAAGAISSWSSAAPTSPSLRSCTTTVLWSSSLLAQVRAWAHPALASQRFAADNEPPLPAGLDNFVLLLMIEGAVTSPPRQGSLQSTAGRLLFRRRLSSRCHLPAAQGEVGVILVPRDLCEGSEWWGEADARSRPPVPHASQTRRKPPTSLFFFSSR